MTTVLEEEELETMSKTKQQEDGREYVVLVRSEEDKDEVWTTLGIVAASSNEQAIRKIAENAAASLVAADTTTFVAIPARSFQPVTVQIQTTTRIILS